MEQLGQGKEGRQSKEWLKLNVGGQVEFKLEEGSTRVVFFLKL